MGTGVASARHGDPEPPATDATTSITRLRLSDSGPAVRRVRRDSIRVAPDRCRPAAARTGRPRTAGRPGPRRARGHARGGHGRWHRAVGSVDRRDASRLPGRRFAFGVRLSVDLRRRDCGHHGGDTGGNGSRRVERRVGTRAAADGGVCGAPRGRDRPRQRRRRRRRGARAPRGVEPRGPRYVARTARGAHRLDDERAATPRSAASHRTAFTFEDETGC